MVTNSAQIKDFAGIGKKAALKHARENLEKKGLLILMIMTAMAVNLRG